MAFVCVCAALVCDIVFQREDGRSEFLSTKTRFSTRRWEFVIEEYPALLFYLFLLLLCESSHWGNEEEKFFFFFLF